MPDQTDAGASEQRLAGNTKGTDISIGNTHETEKEDTQAASFRVPRTRLSNRDGWFVLACGMPDQLDAGASHRSRVHMPSAVLGKV